MARRALRKTPARKRPADRPGPVVLGDQYRIWILVILIVFFATAWPATGWHEQLVRTLTRFDAWLTGNPAGDTLTDRETVDPLAAYLLDAARCGPQTVRPDRSDDWQHILLCDDGTAPAGAVLQSASGGRGITEPPAGGAPPSPTRRDAAYEALPETGIGNATLATADDRPGAKAGSGGKTTADAETWPPPDPGSGQHNRDLSEPQVSATGVTAMPATGAHWLKTELQAPDLLDRGVFLQFGTGRILRSCGPRQAQVARKGNEGRVAVCPGPVETSPSQAILTAEPARSIEIAPARRHVPRERAWLREEGAGGHDLTASARSAPARLCASLGRRGLHNSGWRSGGLDGATWECISELVPIGDPDPQTGQRSSLFFSFRGRDVNTVSHLRFKLNVMNQGEPDLAGARLASLVDLVLRELRRPLPATAVDSIKRLTPVDLALDGTQISFRREVGDVPRFNLIVSVGSRG